MIWLLNAVTTIFFSVAGAKIFVFLTQYETRAKFCVNLITQNNVCKRVVMQVI